MSTDTTEAVQLWTAALRSGEYAQGQHILRSGDRTTHCCLGVAADLVVRGVVEAPEDVKRDAESALGHYLILPPSVAEVFGLAGSQGGSQDGLVERNDATGNSLDFAAIADYIEAGFPFDPRYDKA